MRSAHVQPQWANWLAVAALAALSSFFEIIEAIVGQFVRPDLGAYLGTQGDIWDAQKDMGAAFVGAVMNRPRRYIAKGSNGGTARGLTENLTYTGLTAGVASAI